MTEEDNPTRLVSVGDTGHIDNPYGVLMPKTNPEVYAAERPAPGIRGSYLAYRSDTYHRGAPFGSGTGARIVVAVAFKNAEAEWIGYDTQQNRSTGTRVDPFRRGLDAAPAGALRLAPSRVTRCGTSAFSNGPRSAIPSSLGPRPSGGPSGRWVEGRAQ